MQIAYVNGHFIPADQAVVPIEDRGLLFGDGVFDTIRVQDGVPLFLDRHLARLRDGLDALRIAPVSVSHAMLRELLLRNEVTDGLIRLQITRGVGSLGYLPTGDSPTLIVRCLPSRPIRSGLSLHRSTIRRASPDSLPTHYKFTHGIASTLARLEAQDHGADEALMVDAHGHMAEASAASIFWHDGTRWHTPPLSTGALAGVTRAVLLADDTAIAETSAPADALATASAILLANAAIGLRPVTRLIWAPGWLPHTEVAMALCERYQTSVEKEIAARRSEWLPADTR